MKKSVLLFAALVFALAAYAQKKPKINQALNALQDGNLAEAKEIVDAATEHEKTMEDDKTWYYRGLVYFALDTTSNPEYQGLAPDNAIEIVMESMNKADELKKGSSELYITNSMGLPETKSQQIGNMWVYYLNEGINGLQDSDYQKALDNFEKGMVVDPTDTTEYYYGGMSAQYLEEYDKAVDYFQKYYEYGGTQSDAYKVVVYIQNELLEDVEAALATTQLGKEKFPTDTDFMNNEAAFLIELGREEEAIQGLLKSIEQNPDDPNLYFSVGVLQENLGNKEEAREYYQKSIDIDPDNFNSNFNLGALYYNDALEILKEKNNLGFSAEDQKKAKEMEPALKEAFMKAQPYFEKCHNLNPEDTQSLEVLQTIYSQTGQMDKAEEVTDKLEALNG